MGKWNGGSVPGRDRSHPDGWEDRRRDDADRSGDKERLTDTERYGTGVSGPWPGK